ncbi:MAG: sulfatase [Myxococcota bacterium]
MMLRSRLAVGLTLAAVIGAVGVSLWALRRDPHPDRLNVLVIVWDTVRADRLSLYGHDVPTTPKLDVRAETALVFEQATAPAMWTLPTHASMFTGQFATTHGAVASYRWLDHHHTTLAEHLGEAGYDTFAFTSNLVASPLTNLLQGFETVHTTYPRQGVKRGRYVRASREATEAKLLANDESTEISPSFMGDDRERWGRAVHKDAAPVIAQGLLEWLSERPNPRQPWFAYLNLMEAHSPRVPSAKARAQVMPPRVRARALQVDQSLFAANEYIIGQRRYTKAEWAAIRGVYDATLVDLDDATEALFKALDRAGDLDHTLVILLADHGEHLGEHQRLEHRWSLHQPLLHVPLVVWDPGQPGRRISERVSTAGLFATVLDRVGLPVPEATQAPSWFIEPDDERIYAQLLDPFVSQLAAMREAYPYVDFAPYAETYCAAFEGDLKLLYGSSGRRELFHLGRDPNERRDLGKVAVRKREALVEALHAWEDGLTPYDPGLRTEADGRGANRQDAAEQRMLAALGYVVSEPTPMERLRCTIRTSP